MSQAAIFLSFNNQKEVFAIPVLPAEMTITEGANGNEYQIINGSSINVIQPNKLTEISFDSFFPAQAYPFVNTDEALTIPEYLAYLEKWRDSKRPIRFVFTSISYTDSTKEPQKIAINMPVTIEEFEWTPKAGSDDIDYSITFKRYVFFQAIQTKVKQASKTAAKKTTATTKKKRPSDKVTPGTVTVKSGDSLWTIAKKQLGDGDRWKEIQTLNKIPNAKVNNLKVGTVLKLPKK